MGLLVLLILFRFVLGQYVREMDNIHDNYGFDDLNKLSGLLQKDPKIVYVKPESCTSSKCRVKLSETFNAIIGKGYGVSFKLTHTGLMNSTIDLFVKDVNFNVSTDYIYTTPKAKFYYRIAFKNYDATKYDNCVNNIGVEDFTTVADVMLNGAKGTDWDFAFRKSSTYEIGPLSTDAIKCGHYWPTTLTTCVEKALVVRLDKGISVYKMSREVDLDFTMSAMVNDKVYNYQFAGDFNQPQVWNLEDNLNIEINPLGTIYSGETGYVACLFAKKSKEIASKCYHADSLPELGSIAVSGIGKFQLVDMSTPEKTMFDKTPILSDYIYPCNEQKFKHIKVKGNDQNSLKAKVFDVYSIKKADSQEDKKVLDFSVKEVTSNNLKLGDTCCVKLISPTDLFLENSVSTLVDISEHYKSKLITDLDKLEMKTTNYPKLTKLSFKSLMRIPLMVSILSDGLDIGFSGSEFELKNIEIPRMTYYQEAAGSFFQLTMEYIGQPQNVKIDSSDVNILTKEIYVHKSGKIDELIGFKSKGPMLSKPKICVGNNDYCVVPATIDEKSPKDGMVDDNEQSSGEYVDRAKNLLLRLFSSNWILTAISSIVTIIEIVIVLIIMVMLYKTSRKFLTILCCMASVKEGNMLLTSKLLGKLSDDVKLYRCETYQVKQNVGTWVDKSLDKSLIQNIIQNENGFNIAFCSTTNYADAKWVSCDSYCNPDALTRDFAFHKAMGAKYIDGTIWSTGMIDVKVEDGKKYGLFKKDLYENKTFEGAKDCNDLWGKVYSDSANIYWLKESVMYGDNLFGYSSVKLVIRSGTSDANVFEIFDRSTLYDGFDVLSLNLYGYKGAYHGAEVTIVADASLSPDDRLDDLRRALTLPESAIVHSLEAKQGKYICRHFYFIQCEDRCSFINPTSTEKSKTVTLSKYYPIIDNESKKRLVQNEVVEVCKEMQRLSTNLSNESLSNFKIKQGHSKTHFFHKDQSSRYSLPMDIVADKLDSNCNFKIQFSKIYNKGVHYSTFMVDNNNVYKVKRGGPMKLMCINTGLGSRCKHLNNEITAFVNGDQNELELRTIKYKGMTYSYAIGDYAESMSPIDDDCKGKLFVDQYSNAICSHDCCLVSNDHWQTFNLIKANEKYKMTDSKVFSSWEDSKYLVYNYKDTNWCDYNGFYSSIRCLYIDHKFEVIAIIIFPLSFLISYYVILMFYYLIIYCYVSNPKSGVNYMNRKRYSKKWFITEMADNILKGKPKFWKRSNNKYNIEHEERLLSGPEGRNKVYRRTVRPII